MSVKTYNVEILKSGAKRAIQVIARSVDDAIEAAEKLAMMYGGQSVQVFAIN